MKYPKVRGEPVLYSIATNCNTPSTAIRFAFCSDWTVVRVAWVGMQQAEFETDEMLQLLTEALRRGPGSPEWHQALEKLRDSGAKEADDYRLLMTVRERLESGQSYREVRAGPQFTRELMQKIDDEPDANASAKPRTVLIVSLVCIGLLIGSIAVLVKLMSNGQPPLDPPLQLAGQLFVTPVRTWTFDKEIPEGITLGGDLKIEAADGLRLARTNKTGVATIFSQTPIELRQGVCVEAQIQFVPGAGSQAGIMLSGYANPPAEKSLGITLMDSGFAIVNAAKLEPIKRNLQAGLYTVRVKLDQSHAIIEIDGQIIWQGTHQLSDPAGVTLSLAKLGNDPARSRVTSLRILQP